jgi:predicted nucleotidyltransferase
MFLSRIDTYGAGMSDQDMKNLLDEITRRIREVSDPEQIILFGSRARGDSRPGSSECA